VLGNVVSSGVKVLVLAVIIGIGSTLFAQFTAGFGANQPTIDEAMSIVLAALALLALGIFGPGIANALISGGPQLGAGAAVGTGLAAGGGHGRRRRCGAHERGCRWHGRVCHRRWRAELGLCARRHRHGLPQRRRLGRGDGRGFRRHQPAAQRGRKPPCQPRGRQRGCHWRRITPGGPPHSSGAPAWARRMRRGQALSHGVTTLGHAIRSGDGGGAGSSIRLSEDR